MGKVSEAEKRAIKKYRGKNPDQIGYTALKRGGFNFANALKKDNTKSKKYVTSGYANQPIDGKKRYIVDLETLTSYCVATLKELGVSSTEIKRLFKN